jgi:hypothetical protein
MLFCDKRARASLKTSPSFDFSFYDQMKAMHAEIHLQRVCEMVAMILVVNPAIHLVAQTNETDVGSATMRTAIRILA